MPWWRRGGFELRVAAVLQLLRFLNQRTGQTILMITHNPEAAAFADRTVAIRDGLIKAA